MTAFHQKQAMLELPRVCHVGLVGPDVLAYSRAYRAIGIRTRPQTRYFGFRMIAGTKEFQSRHGLTQTGTVNAETFNHLKYHLDAYGIWLVGQAEKRFEVTPREICQGAFLAMLHTAPSPYEQIRPYPMSVADFDRDGSDCSGTFELAYKLTHDHFPATPDPSNLGFTGYGYTGTLLDNGKRISAGEAQPGDAAFFYWDRHHVGGYLGGGKVFSHGSPPTPSNPTPHVVSASSTLIVEWRSYL